MKIYFVAFLLISYFTAVHRCYPQSLSGHVDILKAIPLVAGAALKNFGNTIVDGTGSTIKALGNGFVDTATAVEQTFIGTASSLISPVEKQVSKDTDNDGF
jgi:hypothetical protein